MSTLKPPPASCVETDGWVGSATRRLLAWWLEAASAALARVAARLMDRSAEESCRQARFEFHAVGDGQGALYVDGELVGWLRGVERL